MRAHERDLLAFHLAFAAIAAGALAIRGEVPVGVVITTLVVAYHLASVGLARVRGHRRWLRWWWFGAVLSLLMVLPDAFLADGLGVLAFPSDGVPDLGPVTLHMAGLWTIPTVVIVAVTDAVAHRRGHRSAVVAAVATAAVVFIGAEAVLTRLPVWEAVGVTTVGNVAVYIVLPELLLGWMVVAAVRWLETSRPLAAVPVAALVAFTYTGAAATSWLIVDGWLASGAPGSG